MPELIRRSALDHYAPGRVGASGGAPGIAITERTNLSMVQVAAFAPAADVSMRVQAAIGLTLSAQPNRSTSSGPSVALWSAPERWLIVEPAQRDLMGLIGRVLAPVAAVTDLSHARTALRLSGPNMRDVLAKGCTIDLHPRAFASGACAITSVAHTGTIIHAAGPDTLDLYVVRSFAEHFWEWLLDAAAEFGAQVNPPEAS